MATETCRDKVIYTAIGVGGLLLLLGLAIALSAICIIATRLCRPTNQTADSPLIKNLMEPLKLKKNELKFQVCHMVLFYQLEFLLYILIYDHQILLII